MTKPRSPALPDLEDDNFEAAMRPLVEKVLPADRKPGKPDVGKAGNSDVSKSGYTDKRKSGKIIAAQEQDRIEATRGKKRRFEYLIPERVGKALAEDAAKRGVSATTRLLEILRDSGYPVIHEDLIDLRKMPKR